MQLKESPTTEDTLINQPKQDNKVEQIIEEPKATTRWQNEVEQAIEKPQAATRWQDEETATAIEPTVEAATPVTSEMKSQPADEQAPPVSSDIEQQPVSPTKGSFGKIKNLFGKPKQQPVSSTKVSLGKIKNLFGKSKT